MNTAAKMSLEEIRALVAELAIQSKETDRRFQETDRKFQETRERVERLSLQETFGITPIEAMAAGILAYRQLAMVDFAKAILPSDAEIQAVLTTAASGPKAAIALIADIAQPTTGVGQPLVRRFTSVATEIDLPPRALPRTPLGWSEAR